MKEIIELTETMKDLIEKAKTNKPGLIALKNALVKLEAFDDAATLREIENELFPETEESVKAKEEVRQLNVLFRMMGFSDMPIETCWLLAQSIRIFYKKGGNFTPVDGIRLQKRLKELF